MLGQAVALDGQTYNVIILAGGKGERMGTASDYIPKALSSIGHERAIDYIIQKYSLIAHKFIIGTGNQADLLTHYVRGMYPIHNIEFSYEPVEELKNNALSTLYCLDHADSRYPTLVTFCDLYIVSNNIIVGDSIFIANTETKGRVGTFRHLWDDTNFQQLAEPKKLEDGEQGVLGTFIFKDTMLLKSIVYLAQDFGKNNDLTWDIAKEYFTEKTPNVQLVDKVYEFGTENDLKEVRRLWEDV